MTRRSYRYRHLTTLAETSAAGTVYFCHYVCWQGRCRERFLADHAPGVLGALRDGTVVMVTLSTAMNYYAECLAFEVIEVLMTPRAEAGNRVVLDFDFQRADRLVARGTQTVRYLRRSAGGTLPAEIPAELLRALGRFDSDEPV
ncbi:MAG TPA: thioesterase family protein [Actinophytocola sp.]|uniref:acyl-CoA thioesterase n=1 Tax=Actinophytocola sp. TaxID=1872138 RepID=UPI002DDD2CAB|nr:thioesterase family protein [Actinophytocola sp.]HEV2783342.1 thioesterase family protein [Actinophytocola sp.]